MHIIITTTSIPTTVSVTLLLIVSTSLSLYLYYTITGASCQALHAHFVQAFFCSTPTPGSQGAHARTRRLPTIVLLLPTSALLCVCVYMYVCVCIHIVLCCCQCCVSLCVWLSAYLLGKPLTPYCPTMPTQTMEQYPQHSSPCSTHRTVPVSLGQSQCVYLSLFVVPTVQHITGCLSIGRSAQLLQRLFVQDVYHANQGPRTRTRPSVSIVHTSLCVLLFLYYLFMHIVMSMSMCLIMCYSFSWSLCVYVCVWGYCLGLYLRDTLSVCARPDIPAHFSSPETGGCIVGKNFFLLSESFFPEQNSH